MCVLNVEKYRQICPPSLDLRFTVDFGDDDELAIQLAIQKQINLSLEVVAVSLSKLLEGFLGSYRACDHDFVVDEPHNVIIEADPDMDPVEPFNTRYLPDIRWSSISRNDTYIIAMVDVGFGTLNYLAYDYPKNTKVVVFLLQHSIRSCFHAFF